MGSVFNDLPCPVVGEANAWLSRCGVLVCHEVASAPAAENAASGK